MDAFKSDFEKNDKLLKSILGDNFSTRVIRCPGGYMSWKGMKPLDKYLDENKIAQSITQLLEDDMLMQKMGQNGIKAISEEFNWKQEEKKLINIYKFLGGIDNEKF